VPIGIDERDLAHRVHMPLDQVAVERVTDLQR
jgi:hypothetical protein